VRRRFSVHFERCDRLLKRLRASRLDNSHDIEMRRLLRVDLLIIDDFALQPLDPLETPPTSTNSSSNATVPPNSSSTASATANDKSPASPNTTTTLTARLSRSLLR
jgi:hypothetical protein